MFSGKVGAYVGCRWKGGMYIRSKPCRAAGYKPSPAQLAQQRKFSLANHFLQTIAPLIKISFQADGSLRAPKNRALSWILKQAITGKAPDIELDYPQILISQGVLPNALDTTAVATGTGYVQFLWKKNGGQGKARSRDKVMIVVHCPALNKSVYNTAAATRADETAMIDTTVFTGQTVHTWIGFITEDGEMVANSNYTGELNL